MSQPILVTSRPLPDPFVAGLRQFGEVRIGDGSEQPTLLEGAEVYVGTSMDPVSDRLIESFGPQLGLIANLGVGIDHIDLAAAAARGIQVSNTPVVTEDTADLTMALVLAACRRLSVSERLLREGHWAAGAATLGWRVHGKTMGIVGFGEIGQAVARRAAGFGMGIIYYGPRRKVDAEANTGASYRANLDDLLAEADIVSLNCPLTPETRHLINAGTLSCMKPGSVLVNTGRGALVDEAALAEALASGHLGGAGLDVFEFEPEITPALLAFDNVALLPHIGSATHECRTDVAMRAMANIRSYLESGKPLDACT